MNILDFARRKRVGKKLSMITCYDYWSASILNTTEIDSLLVGDSLAMVMHGYDSTVHATLDMMVTHIAAVRRGAPNKFIVGDMPFLATRRGLPAAIDAVAALMQAGANAIKVEGAAGQLELIAHIVESGVPVMGHLGLTPQSVEAFGGHRVQGRSATQAKQIRNDAAALQRAGCFALVLECVPSPLAKAVTATLNIPTIGIGAGPDTDGQVLVLQDMLGMDSEFNPTFLRRYGDGQRMIASAVNQYHRDTVSGSFPSADEAYAA